MVFKRNKKQQQKQQPLHGFAPSSATNSSPQSKGKTKAQASASASFKQSEPFSRTKSNSNSNSNSNKSNFISRLEINSPDVIERVRTTIQNSHVFKLPVRQTGSIGWRGADWKEKVWQGTVKVVDRNNLTAILLVDGKNGSHRNGNNKADGNTNIGGGDSNNIGQTPTIFAVCPIIDGINAVERCVDSSRYFVLRIENEEGRHMFIGLAFNERNDAFDFNTALQDAKKEREFELRNSHAYVNNEGGGGSSGPSLSFVNSSLSSIPTKDYSLKEGEKITVNIPKKQNQSSNSSRVGGAAGTGTMAFANFQKEFEDQQDYSSISSNSNANSSSPDHKDNNQAKDVAAGGGDRNEGGWGWNSLTCNASNSLSRTTTAPGNGSSTSAIAKKKKSRNSIGGGGFALKPSKRDTPARTHS